MLADRVRMGRKKRGVYLAQDGDFVRVNNWLVYRGSKLKIEIPHVIQGAEITNYAYMFNRINYSATPVTRVDSNNKNVIYMSNMFYNFSSTTLDLSNLDTSEVTHMSNMFRNSSITTLNVSSFDTSKVISMNSMFRDSSTTVLDLSSFDTFKVTDMNDMFNGSSATTGYARTQADANRFNASSNKPSGLTFIVKP